MSLHPLEQIHGVSTALAGRFAALGIDSCEALLAAAAGGTGGLASALDGVSDEQLVQSFVPQARFLIAGADEALAGALVRLEVRRLSDLLAADTEQLHTRLAGELSAPPAREALQALQLEAGRHLITGLALVEVRDARTGTPVVGAELVLPQPGISPFSGGAVRASDAAGLIVTPRLRAGESHLGTIYADGYRYATVGLSVGPGGVRRVVVRMRQGERGAQVDEARSGRMLVPRGRVAVHNATIALDDVPAGEPLVVTQLGARELRLTRLTRRREGVVLRVDNAKLPTADAPAGTKRGDVLVIEGDRSVKRLGGAAARSARWRRFGSFAATLGEGD